MFHVPAVAVGPLPLSVKVSPVRATWQVAGRPASAPRRGRPPGKLFVTVVASGHGDACLLHVLPFQNRMSPRTSGGVLPPFLRSRPPTSSAPSSVGFGLASGAKPPRILGGGPHPASGWPQDWNHCAADQIQVPASVGWAVLPLGA